MDNIDAQELRDLVRIGNEEKHKQRLNDLFVRMEKSAKYGYYYELAGFKLKETDKKYLHEKGFKLINMNAVDPRNVEIRWDDLKETEYETTT